MADGDELVQGGPLTVRQEYALKQYEALRAELNTRMSQMTQLMGFQSVAVILALSARSSPYVLLGAAIMSLSLWIAYIHRQQAVPDLFFKIRHQVETELFGKQLHQLIEPGDKLLPIRNRQTPGGLQYLIFVGPAVVMTAYFFFGNFPHGSPRDEVSAWLPFVVLIGFLGLIGCAMASHLTLFKQELDRRVGEDHRPQRPSIRDLWRSLWIRTRAMASWVWARLPKKPPHGYDDGSSNDGGGSPPEP